MDGFLVINKPLGYTSRDIVNKVSSILNTKKVGHTGTLDPNASGVMILAVGKALKAIELVSDGDKEYIAKVILGIETDTLDMDNNATILKEENVNIDSKTITKVVDSFKKTYMQEVPKYSAVKVNGKKLYEYARNNIPVRLPKKEVTIKDISIIDNIECNNGKISFSIKCTVSKGTYIRSLVRDIGRELNVPAVMSCLVRTRIDSISIKNSYTLEDIENGNYKLISVVDMLAKIPRINIHDDMVKKIKNGMILDKLFDSELAFVLDKNDNLLALYKNVDNKSRPYKMFI